MNQNDTQRNLFGDLRALLQQEHIETDELLELVERQQDYDPQVYREQWLPYMNGHALPVVRVYSIEDLEQMATFLPSHTMFDLSIPGYYREPEWFTETPYLERVVRLRVGGLSGATEFFARMEESGRFKQLISLDLAYCNMGNKGLAALLRMSSMSELRELNLYCNNLRTGMTKLARQRAFPKLERLDLGRNSIKASGVKQLCRGSGLRTLKALSLKDCLNELSQVQPLMEALAGSEVFSNLEELSLANLSFMETQSEHLSCLLDSPAFPRLERLDLSGATISKEMAVQIARAPLCALLTHLSLRQCKLDTRAVTTIAKGDRAPALRALDLSGSTVARGSISKLAKSNLTGLHTLHLNETNMIQSTLDAMLSSETLSNLRELTLHHTECDLFASPESAARLPHLETLTQSVLHGCTSQDAEHIAFRLRTFLLVRGRILPPADIQTLFESEAMSQLKHLAMNVSDYEADVIAKILATEPNLSSLRTFQCRAKISSKALLELIKSKHFRHLQSLDIQGTDPGKRGCRALLDRDNLPRLRHLNLDHNRPKDSDLGMRLYHTFALTHDERHPVPMWTMFSAVQS